MPLSPEALTQAYRHYTDRTGYCAIGSVKSNIGHLDAAAGIAGLIKVALALELEGLWNDLAARLPFSLLCGYPAGLLAADDDREAAAVQHVCHLHTAVVGPSPGHASVAPAEA